MRVLHSKIQLSYDTLLLIPEDPEVDQKDSSPLVGLQNVGMQVQAHMRDLL